MGAVIVIPARYASTRFPGKPLTPLRGAGGVTRSLLRRCWEAAGKVRGVDQVLIATDDSRIAEHARGFGADVAMTGPERRNGTERCAEAVAALPRRPELVINFQGDAPLTPPAFVEALIAAMRRDAGAAVATPVLRCDAETLAHFRQDRREGRVGGTTAVFNRQMRALYFSKEVIPYADAVGPDGPIPVFHHVGLYAYRPQALASYAETEPGPLERLEGLEQLRFLETGAPVLCVQVDAGGRVFWEVNNPVDVGRVERALAAAGVD